MALRNWIGLFLMGAINNLPYVIVTSAASTIADSFHQKNLVGVVFGANVALSVFVKALNTFVLLNVSYSLRFIVNGCVMLLGLFGVAYAFNFAFAIASIAVVGSTAAFGENVSLGFLSCFPSKLVNAWSSGTGMAGLLGSTLYIGFGCVVGNGQDKTSKLHNLTRYAFLLSTPVVLIYWLAYFVLIKRPSIKWSEETHERGDSPSAEASIEGAWKKSDDTDEAKSTIPSDNAHIQDSSEGTPLKLQESAHRRILRCLKLVLWLSFNLCSVYIFEYVPLACTSKVRPNNEYNIGCPELYASLQLCYQAGVFVSRSSVQFVRFRRVEILTILQFVNMILWLLDVQYKFLPVYLLPALMIYVGLLGGASYVNVFYSLLHDDKYPQADKEMCINLTGLFINLGIVLGTCLETALFTTVLKDD